MIRELKADEFRILDADSTGFVNRLMRSRTLNSLPVLCWLGGFLET